MCATCPFREGSPHSALKEYLSDEARTVGRICHSTGNSVFYGKTGKKRKSCRWTRDIQLKMMHAAGVLDEPTD